MIGWLAVLALTLVAFCAAAFGLRMPRQGWAMFGAVLVFGLAGYAWQGSPDQPSSPKEKPMTQPQSGEEMVEARRDLFDPAVPRPDYLMLSDGFARRGQFSKAAALLRKGLQDNPEHLEGWLALGMALVAHSDGFVTPAAAYAYEQASAIDRFNPAPDFFFGFSLLRSGEIRSARDIWSKLLERSPPDAPWRSDLERRVEALDEMIANAPMLQ